MPTANSPSNKAKRRRHALTSASEDTNHGLDESFVFDAKVDREGRLADARSSSSARDRKRELEHRFASSAPTLRHRSRSTTRASRNGSLGNNAMMHHSIQWPIRDHEATILVPSKANMIDKPTAHKRATSPRRSLHHNSGHENCRRKAPSRNANDFILANKRPPLQRGGSVGSMQSRNSSRGSQSGQRSDSSDHRPKKHLAGRKRPPLKRGRSMGSVQSWNSSQGENWSQSGHKILSSENHSHPNNHQAGSRAPAKRSRSMDRSSMSKNPSKRSKKPQKRSRSLDTGGRRHSGKNNLPQHHRPSIIQSGDSTLILLPVTKEQAKMMSGSTVASMDTSGTRGTSGKSSMIRMTSASGDTFVIDNATSEGGALPFIYSGYFSRKIPPIEEKPPKSLVLIWIVISAELGFDLATTIIAFVSLVDEDECCGERIELGPIPMTVTMPFFLLLVAELAFLLRAMVLAMWPSLLDSLLSDKDLEIRESRGTCMKLVCCWLRWKAKMLLKVLNFFVLLNPFFGCIIAWILLYQSDKVESFVVLGLEGASILLHFMSVYLEGSCNTCGQFAFHCIPLIPFFVSVTMILFYLKQGGVCYLVDQEVFYFTGCELCADGIPPVDGVCQWNGTNYTIGEEGLLDLSNFQELNNFKDFDLSGVGSTFTARAPQGEFCGNLKGNGPNASFCFFEY